MSDAASILHELIDDLGAIMHPEGESNVCPDGGVSGGCGVCAVIDAVTDAICNATAQLERVRIAEGPQAALEEIL